jgi:adenosylcobinamide-GDP ribazoletransferase
MRDSQAGAIGFVSVALLLLLKFLCIESLSFEARAGALFLFPVAGRWAMVPMASWAGYARKEGGVGKAFTGGDNIAPVRATAIAALFFVLVLGLWGLFILGILAFFAFALTNFFKKRLGGATGDVFGFQSEITEVLFLVLAVACF